MPHLTQKQRNEIVEELVDNSEVWGEEDRLVLESFNDDKLEALLANDKHPGGHKPGSTGSEGMSDEELEEEMKKRLAGKKSAGKETGNDEGAGIPNAHNEEEVPAMTAEEWLSYAPEEVQNTFRYAQKIEEGEKGKLVEKLTANCPEADKRVHQDRLMHRSLEDLRNDIALMPTVENVQPDNGQSPHSPHAAPDKAWLADQAQRALSANDGDEALGLPTMDWSGENDGKVTYNTGKGLEHESSRVVEDDWIRRAPPGIRAAVQNAMSIEQKEKEDLVASLTANMADEVARRRLSDRLLDKSLSELRDLAALTPASASSPPANYAGQAAPATNQKLSDADKGDILPLPQCNWAEGA